METQEIHTSKVSLSVTTYSDDSIEIEATTLAQKNIPLFSIVPDEIETLGLRIVKNGDL